MESEQIISYTSMMPPASNADKAKKVPYYWFERSRCLYIVDLENRLWEQWHGGSASLDENKCINTEEHTRRMLEIINDIQDLRLIFSIPAPGIGNICLVKMTKKNGGLQLIFMFQSTYSSLEKKISNKQPLTAVIN